MRVRWSMVRTTKSALPSMAAFTPRSKTSSGTSSISTDRLTSDDSAVRVLLTSKILQVRRRSKSSSKLSKRPSNWDANGGLRDRERLR